MGRGPKKHLKRLHAPKKWMLNKLGGSYAPRPSTGPHKLRECLPVVVLLRNRLKYALSRSETVAILKNRNIQVDGKVRTDLRYPTGFQDVVTIEKTNENFRILYDHKGRFVVHRITPEEAKYKLCKVKKLYLAANGVPTITTHDGRTIRYPNPDVREGDTIKLDIASGKMTDFIRFDVGNMVFVNGGRNTGRIGTILHREKHEGSFEIIHLKDAAGKEFATRAGYCFIVGKGKREYISLPKHRGVHMSPVDELEARLAKKN